MRTVAEILKWRTRLHPDREALHFESGRLTYRDLDLRTNKLANALLTAGAQQGDRIGVLDKGHDKIVETIFGISKMGGVFTPLNWRLAAPEIEQILLDAEIKVLFVGEEFNTAIERVSENLSQLELIISYDGPVNSWTPYDDFLNKGTDAEPHIDCSEDDTVWQMYTSGTTGLPKGVELTHSNLLSMCTSSDMDYSGDDNSFLACMPNFHIGGAGALLSAFFSGARIVIAREFVPALMLDLLEQERISHAIFVPAMLNILLQVPNVGSRDYSSLKSIIYGASPIPEDLLKQSIETFRCKFSQAYGLTETTGSATMLMPWEHVGELAKLRSCGLPVFGHELRIENERGEQCETGEVGEIVVRGGNVMKGYWNKPEETEKVLKNGWLRTGDAGYLDEDGFLYIHDRVKDMIVSGGENVYPAEVENVLYSHPDLVDVAVIGVPDERWGEAVKAVAVRRDGSLVDEKEIIAFCADRIAGYKRPRSVDFVEELPRNPSGKILKTKLRETYWQDHDRKVN